MELHGWRPLGSKHLWFFQEICPQQHHFSHVCLSVSIIHYECNRTMPAIKITDPHRLFLHRHQAESRIDHLLRGSSSAVFDFHLAALTQSISRKSHFSFCARATAAEWWVLLIVYTIILLVVSTFLWQRSRLLVGVMSKCDL